MATPETPDLDAIEQRAKEIAERQARYPETQWPSDVALVTEDIPALIAECRRLRALVEEIASGGGVYYIPQERAMAPGIAGEWPAVIPHGPHGRLVRRALGGAP